MPVAIGQLPVFNALTGSLPCEGAKCLPYQADFSAANEYDFDLTAQWQSQQFSTLQGFYIDNSANSSTVTITCGTTNQTIVVPPQSCGYYTMLMTTPPKFSAVSAGAVVVYIALMNFYVPPTVWKVT